MITVIGKLRDEGNLEKAGGIAYVSQIVNCEPSASNIKFYAKIIAEKAIRRQLIDAATKIATIAYDENIDVNEVLDDAEQKIMVVRAQRSSANDLTPFKELVKDSFNKIEIQAQGLNGGITGLKTHFLGMDKITKGLQKGDYIVIGARPSMGKTAFMLDLARNVASKKVIKQIKKETPEGTVMEEIEEPKKVVAVFSAEMSKEALTDRLLGAASKINMQKIPNEKELEWDNLIAQADVLSGCKIHIDDVTKKISGIRTRCRNIKQKEGSLDLVVVDYIQLLDGTGKSENRTQDVSAISRGLKGIAREFNVPVIALSQLSRSVESRQDKHPMLSDLRESGSIEQDADLVMFLYRDDYYNMDCAPENEGTVDINIAKHRNGALGMFKMFFIKEIQRFGDLTYRPEPK